MKAREALAALVKSALRPLYHGLRRNLLLRRIVTANYTAGRLAVGERNTYYAIPAGWITVDIQDADFNVDLTRHEPLPFADNSQSVIYSAHMIEHIDQMTLLHFLREAHRILRPGGAIRLEAPDAEVIIEEYRRGASEVLQYFMDDLKKNVVDALGYPDEYAERHIALISFLSCYVEGGRHLPVYATKQEVERKLASLGLEAFGQWCVSLQTAMQQATHGHVNPLYYGKLHGLLQQCGFRDIVRATNGQTNIAGLPLRGLEREVRAPFSFYVEARK